MSSAAPDNEPLWRAILTGEDSPIRADRVRYKRLPGNPRCKVCRVPLGGPLSPIVRKVTKRAPSKKNPNFCNLCDEFVRTHPGGTEIEITLLFADVRGSTTLAEQMGPAEFNRLMNRFYSSSYRVIVDSDALVDQFVGDEVIGLYLPLMNPQHASAAIQAAEALLVETGHGDAQEPWLPLGAGVHTGIAFVGSIASNPEVAEFTAMGDAVNVTARLSSAAARGQVLISKASCESAGLDRSGLESRLLNLKGRTEPIEVSVLEVGAGATRPNGG